MVINKIISELKTSNEDYEWYPTTDEILKAIKSKSQKIYKGKWSDTDIDHELSILDIGCGDGRSAKYLSCGGKKVVIEKSEIHRNKLSHEFIPVGNNFHEVNLIGLNKVNIIFCNPPYSEFIEWTEKIIMQGNAEYAYLVIPTRWKDCDRINNALKLRNVTFNNIGTFSFNKADRQSRAEVDVIEFDLNSKNNYNSIDPFKLWFNLMYPNHNIENVNKYKLKSEIYNDEKVNLKKDIDDKLVPGENYINILVQLYNKELIEYQETFNTLNNIPHNIIEILDISQSKLCNILKEELSSLKKKYWLEFFNRYEPITSKLTSYGKRILLDELNNNVGIDFTIDNIYAITIWAIKQANNLYDDQLVDLMNKLLTYANIKLYKSNKRTFDEEDWRFNRCDIRKKLSKYYLNLDLRIVLHDVSKFKLMKGEIVSDYNYINNLHKRSHCLINDILITANNLGFNIKTDTSYDRIWYPGKEQIFYFKDGQILLKIRGYLNGNLHLKFNTIFLKAFNIEFSKIKKWIKSKKDIVDEMDISEKDANYYFNNNYKLLLDINNILIG